MGSLEDFNEMTKNIYAHRESPVPKGIETISAQPNLRAVKWKPNQRLIALAQRRCSWVDEDALNDIPDPEQWLLTIIVSCYFQGMLDGILYLRNRRKRAAAKPPAECICNAGFGMNLSCPVHAPAKEPPDDTQS